MSNLRTILVLTLVMALGSAVRATEDIDVAQNTENVGVFDSFKSGFANVFAEIKQNFTTNLGKIRDFMNGEYVEENDSELTQFEVDYIKQAASKGNDVEAIYAMGVLHANGYMVEKDEKKAAEFMTKAADMGYENAINILGVFYVDGVGVERDLKKAVELFEKAASMGNTSAMINLAAEYERGEVVEQDVEKAKALYAKAAELGSEKAVEIFYNKWGYGL